MTREEIFLKLYMWQMTSDNISSSTIDFFKLVYPLLTATPPLSCSRMAELSYMSPQAAKKHILKLTRNGYLSRRHYRGWSLVSTAIKDPLLRTIQRATVGG